MKPIKPILRNLRCIVFYLYFSSSLFAQSEASVVINEIRTGEPGGTDSNEFIELKGDPGTSLEGYWYLVIGDHTSFGSNDGINVPDKKGGVVEFAINLDGYSIPHDGLFLITTTNMQFDVFTLNVADVDMLVNRLIFEDSDNVTHLLVKGYTGMEVSDFADQYDDLAVDIDDDDDGVPNAALPWTELIDAIGIVDVPNDASPEEYVYGTTFGGDDIGPDGNFAPGMVFRGFDDGVWNMGTFNLLNPAGDGLFEGDTFSGPALDSPGTPNPVSPPPVVAPLIESFSPGSVQVGDIVTIKGKHFNGTTSVTVGGTEASFTIVDAETIEISVDVLLVSGFIGITTPAGAVTSGLELEIIGRGTIIYFEDFRADLGDFSVISIASDRDWTHGFYNEEGYAGIGGFGADTASDDWLISPAIDLTNTIAPILNFSTARNFDGPSLEVLASDDFDGVDPSFATWTALSAALSEDSYAVVESGDVDLSAYVDGTVHIAFRYTSNGGGTGEGANYQINDFAVIDLNNLRGVVIEPDLGIIGGKIEGVGSYFAGDAVTLRAVPDPGYQFSSWEPQLFQWVADTPLAEESHVVIVTNADGTFYSFNGLPEFRESRRYFLEERSYTLKGVPYDHPLAILNADKSAQIDYTGDNTTPIEIHVSGGGTASPYYQFNDASGNEITSSFASGYALMRGRTYRFVSDGIDASNPFMVNSSPLGAQESWVTGTAISGTGQILEVYLPEDYTGTVFYFSANDSFLSQAMNLSARSIDGVLYDFYWGDITVDVSDDFGSVSLASLRNGSMGGENVFIYDDGSSINLESNPVTITVEGDLVVEATFAQDTIDADGDGLTAYEEHVFYATDPDLVDTDGDSYDDYMEVKEFGSDPLNASSVPTYAISVGGFNGSVQGSGDIEIETLATLTATPEAGFVFAGWTGDANGNVNPLNVLVDANKDIRAEFISVENYNLIHQIGFAEGTTSGINQGTSAVISDPGTYGLYSLGMIELGSRLGGIRIDRQSSSQLISFEIESSVDLKSWSLEERIEHTVSVPENGSLFIRVNVPEE